MCHWCVPPGHGRRLGRLLPVFREDDCRVRAGNAAENFAVMRHLSLNLLKSLKDTKLSIKLRRMNPAWNEDFLLKVLVAHPDVG